MDPIPLILGGLNKNMLVMDHPPVGGEKPRQTYWR